MIYQLKLQKGSAILRNMKRGPVCVRDKVTISTQHGAKCFQLTSMSVGNNMSGFHLGDQIRD